MSKEFSKTKQPVYQLISSPAVFKNDNDEFNTVYSILSVQLEMDAAKTVLVYDIARTKAMAEKIFSEVIKASSLPDRIHEFIEELL